MTASGVAAVFIVIVIFVSIIFIGITEASDPTNQKEVRYQEYKARMDKKEDLERELLEFAERYEKEKEDGD